MFIIPYVALSLTACSGSVVPGFLDWTNIFARPIRHAVRHGPRIDRGKRQLGYVPECKDGYENVDGSTMCLVDSPNYIEGTAGVTQAEIETILKEHNKYRGAVHPPAKAMRKVYWDDELAKLAEKWAKQCVVGHDLGNGRLIPKYNIIPGQNGGYQMSNWEAVIGAWFSERDLFRYGEEPDNYLGLNGWLKIGHYAMMTVDTVVLIGCGYAKCNTGAQDYFFCNYIPGPTLIPFPYRIGLPCDKCLHNCSMNLCDCGTVFCFNGGESDMETCSCECKFPYRGANCLIDPCPGRRCEHDGILDTSTCTCTCPYPYTGELCEILSCDFRPDGDSCESLSTDYCVFKSIKKACPMLCDICPDFCPGLRCDNGVQNISNCQCTYPCGNKTCANSGKLKVDSCNCTCKYPYAGEYCEIKECTGKLDPDFCKIYWPKYLCTFLPVARYCPVMCDICQGPCPNINCQNNGILTKDCTCRCHYPYSGVECQISECESGTNGKTGCISSNTRYAVKTENCTKKADRKECGIDWPKTFCSRFSNVRIYCPNLCGVCPAVCEGKICQNLGSLNVETCDCVCHQNYTGQFCQVEKCGSKKCLNYGTLDLDTCYCHCPPNYTGDTCEVWDCPESDPEECGTNEMPSYQCFTHWDVPFVCPFMCGHCPLL